MAFNPKVKGVFQQSQSKNFLTSLKSRKVTKMILVCDSQDVPDREGNFFNGLCVVDVQEAIDKLGTNQSLDSYEEFSAEIKSLLIVPRLQTISSDGNGCYIVGSISQSPEEYAYNKFHYLVGETFGDNWKVVLSDQIYSDAELGELQDAISPLSDLKFVEQDLEDFLTQIGKGLTKSKKSLNVEGGNLYFVFKIQDRGMGYISLVIAHNLQVSENKVTLEVSFKGLLGWSEKEVNLPDMPQCRKVSEDQIIHLY